MQKMAPSQLIVLDSADYFRAAVEGAFSSLKIDAPEQVRYYLVSILSKFVASDNLFPKRDDGTPEEDTLALQLASALEEENRELRRNKLRHLGDFSLYIAGYFAESLNRKVVDIDYYKKMGGTAYNEVANTPGGKQDNELFEELASGFPKYVDVLGQVSEESLINTEDSRTLLQVYELWARTGSEKLANQLSRAGIVLVDSKKSKGH